MTASPAAIAFNERWTALEQVAKGHVCAVCQGRLGVAKHGDTIALRCLGKCHTFIEDHAITKPQGYYKEQMAHYYGQEGKPMTTQALTTYTEQQMVERVGMAKFPKDLTQVEKQVLARVAISYGLDPLMGELMIYQGAPCVRIEGRRRKAQETGQLLGITTRPMTQQERQDRNVKPEDFAGYAMVRRATAGQVAEFEGYRVIKAAEVAKADTHTPLFKWPQDMAEKRAEALALRRGFNVPLPSAEDFNVDDDEPPKATVRVVNCVTGEIKNGHATAPEEGTPEPSASAQELAKAMGKTAVPTPTPAPAPQAPPAQPTAKQGARFANFAALLSKANDQGVDAAKATAVIKGEWEKSSPAPFTPSKIVNLDAAWALLHGAGLVTATPEEFEYDGFAPK